MKPLRVHDPRIETTDVGSTRQFVRKIHSGVWPGVCETFHPKVFWVFTEHVRGADCVLNDGDMVNMGDENFEIIHMPGHSSDSICSYNQAQGVLFVGDSPALTASATGTYEASYVAAIEKVCARISGGSSSGTALQRRNAATRVAGTVQDGRRQPTPIESNRGFRISRRQTA